jgi:hypothetical protein
LIADAAGSSEFLEAVVQTCFFFVVWSVGEKSRKVRLQQLVLKAD